MLITQKHKYALRAIFELAKHHGCGQVKLSDIAAAQAIPLRFLEVLTPPNQVTVGEIFRFIDDPGQHDRCDACIAKEGCPLHDNCAFMPMWERVCQAIYAVYDQTTIQDLLNNEKMTPALPRPPVPG